ncbi:MAG TPA: ROK family protein [Candidatus Elarobacter sp.]|nr:ROK family protein [Candidatus Elarobacter sp.]
MLPHPGDGAGGRRNLIRAERERETIAGVNVGGTTTSVVLGTREGTILDRRAWPTQTRAGEALLGAVVNAIRDVAPDAPVIGVAIGGPMDARTGTVISPPHLPGMHGFPLAARLRDALARPVHVHHDAAACALAEYHWGADRGARGIAYLTCGTGFGAGLVLDGRARYGSRGYSPELGHIRYRDDGPDVFGKPGSFESFGAASALPKIARLYDPSYDAATGAEVAERAARGDALARRAIAENAAAVGAACALLADLLVLDVIVLGSLAAYLGDPWIARVREMFAREALPHHAAACTLRAPSLPDLQDLSGLAAAVSPF